MQNFLTGPLFLWPRGKRGRWKITAPPQAEIVYGDGAWPTLSDPDGEPYSPLSDPHIFEAFGAVGRLAIETGDYASDPGTWIVGGVLALTADYADASESARAQHRARSAEDDPAVRKAILDFTRDYGALEDFSGYMRDFPVHKAIPARAFIIAASDMAEALRLAQIGEPHPRWLDETIYQHLLGVHPAPFTAAQLGRRRGLYGFTCDSLLAALWWQFAQADGGGGAWRVCKGCRRIFVQSRKDQDFHDKNCRNRTNVAKAAKKKATEKGRLFLSEEEMKEANNG